MNTKCGQCQQEKECTFQENPADSGRGEWLCDDCIKLRQQEMNDALKELGDLE